MAKLGRPKGSKNKSNAFPRDYDYIKNDVSSVIQDENIEIKDTLAIAVHVLNSNLSDHDKLTVLQSFLK